MKRAIKFESKVVATTLCVVAAGWLAAQAQDTPAGGTGTGTGINQPQARQSVDQSTPATDQPMKLNKCSHLVGTIVENPQGEKLGKIEDIVVNLNTGRVSYCVLEPEHKVFSNAKYLAVPLAAFEASADGDRLILRADKDKLAQAKGFDRDNWPAITESAWGAQPFWQEPQRPATTTPNPGKAPSTDLSH
jgi:sporulation protein YlmC with PRC-barrel domain